MLRSEERKILAGENDPFPPLTSASPRLLFDFFSALMSPKDGEKTHTKCRRAKEKLAALATISIFPMFSPCLHFSTSSAIRRLWISRL